MQFCHLTIVLVVIVFSACTQTGNRRAGSQRVDPDDKYRYKIAYNVLMDPESDDYEVYIMNWDGSGQKNLSKHNGMDWVYYAYEDKIYFASDRDTTSRVLFLYVMDVNGEHIRKVSDIQLSDATVSGRNAGRELIIKPHPNIDTAFYLIHLQNGSWQTIQPALDYFHDPCFSPDGKRIVFRGARESSSGWQSLNDELYIINTDGSDLKRLTYYPEDDNTAAWFDYRAGPPVWFQQNRISYASKQNGSYSIFYINPDGSNLTRLTSDENNQVYHSWTPDGSKMVFEQFTNDYKHYNIYRLDGETKTITQLTDDSLIQQAPVFVGLGN